MKRSTLLAIVGGLCVGCAGLWLARDSIGAFWWSWQAERPVSAGWAGSDCADPGTGAVFRAVVQLEDLGCSPDTWLAWLEEDLTRTGARSWADALRTTPEATPRAQFRLALALSRSKMLVEPELATWVDHPEVASSEREWTRRWLAVQPSLPSWADPQVQHGVMVQRFLDGELPTHEWLEALRASRVAPGAIPHDLLQPAVDRTVTLLRSADPAQAPISCAQVNDACWLSLIEGTQRVVAADADGIDGAGRAFEPAQTSAATVADGVLGALYGAGDPRIESTRRWIHALGDWASRAESDVVSRGLWIDADIAPAAATLGQVIGERGGAPWTRALLALAVAQSQGAPRTVTALRSGAVGVSDLHSAFARCEASPAEEQGVSVSEAQVVARAAVEGLELALLSGDATAARRLSGLAERLDPERFAGLAAAVDPPNALPGPYALGARMGRTDHSADGFADWVESWRAEDVDPCALPLPL